MTRFLFAALLWGVLAIAAQAEPANLARATPGYLYFNLPGATKAEHDSELVNCSNAASNNYLADAPAKTVDTYLSKGIVGGLVTGAMLSGWQRAQYNIGLEHCMVVRGWRLVRLDAELGANLESLDSASLAHELTPLIGAAIPEGEIVRIWRNEGADGNTIVARSPANAKRVLLSALAADPQALPPDVPVRILGPGDLTFEPVIQPVSLADVSHPPADKTLLIAGLVGPSKHRLFALDLRNQRGATVETLQLTYRGGARDGKKRKNTLAFVVPAGEWSIAGFSIHLNTCLGAPSFVANEGNVIFLGEFNTGGSLQPDMSTEAMARHVPKSLHADVQNAQWVNGATWPCPPFNFYAIEFDGAPFRPGYEWGSRARNNH